MSALELAAEIIGISSDHQARLDELATKVEEVMNEVARASDLSADEVLNALVQRQLRTQRLRGLARVQAEQIVLAENADRIEQDTARILEEAAK